MIQLFYYLGLVSCGFSGAFKSIDGSKFKCLFTAVLNGFAGGITRDIFILHRFPALFSLAAIPDLLLALSAAIFFRLLYAKQRYRKRLLTAASLCDSVGVCTFLFIGFEAAIGMSLAMRMFSAFTTATFGGLIAQKVNDKKVESPDVRYYAVIAWITVLYTETVQDFAAKFTIILLGFFSTQLMTSSNVEKICNLAEYILYDFRQDMYKIHLNIRYISRKNWPQKTIYNRRLNFRGTYIRFHRFKFC